MPDRRPALAAIAVMLAIGAGPAGAQSDDVREMVKVTAPNRAMAAQLAVMYDVAYATGARTATVVVSQDEIAQLKADGYTVGATVADGETIDDRLAETRQDARAEARSERYAAGGVPASVTAPGEVVIMRAYTFSNSMGKFLYVEAHSKLGTADDTTTANLSVASAASDGVFGSAVPFTMPLPITDSTTYPFTNTQQDDAHYTDVGQYMYHRHLQPITGPDPVKVRVASDKGGVDEAPVTTWLGRQLPPFVEGFQKGFVSRYMDPTEVYQRFDQLAKDFPQIAEQVPLPHLTNGYRRKAQTVLGNSTAYTGQGPNLTNGSRLVILESHAWGHEGGNDLTAQIVNPASRARRCR